ncbi:actin-related protein 8-like [Oopsacas minuta]|uniref:Actin-related protein 8-like n=1 Tax=Oopsacas minuta TaxID=111878 RepID=A0AAV7KIY3_9METZ|nr:actin-related protein 8-like [Oopsacas minuta]
MATKYSDEIPMNPFELTEQLINSTFEKIIRIATERKDQLLVQLFDMKQDHLRKENTRKKQLADLEKMIRQLMETTIQQNEVVKLQEDQIKNWKKEQKKYEIETPIPILSFNTEGLDSLLEQLEKLGSIQEIAGLYRNKIEPIRRIGKPGSEKGELNYPHGLALDGDKIYIADTINIRIQIFSTEGKFIHEFGKGELWHPYGIALYKEWVFISDRGLNAIYKFSKINYKLIKSVKKGVSFPFGLTTDTNGEVLVADYRNNIIAVFSSDLKYIREIGKDKLINPRDVKINNNNIFVADNNEINNIHIFSKSGTHIDEQETELQLPLITKLLNTKSIGGADTKAKLLSIEEAIHLSINCSNEQNKQKIYKNIVITGAGFQFPKSLSFLQNRLKETLPSALKKLQVEIFTPPREGDISKLSWTGGRIVASLDIFSEVWIKREEWINSGVRLIRERSPFIW